MTDAGFWWAAAATGVVATAVAGLVTSLVGRWSSAAARHQIWAAALLVSGVVPFGLAARWVVHGLTTSDLVWVPSDARGEVWRIGGMPGEIVVWGIWAIPVFVLLSRLAAGIVTAARVAKRGEDVVAGPWARALWRAARAVGLVRPPALRASPGVRSPLTTGIVQSVILMPDGAPSSDPTWTRAVLLHECAHVARRDVLYGLVASVACALHWFNPLVWYAARRMRLESECACDDRVVGEGVRPAEYVRRLLAEVDVLGAPPAWVGLGSSQLVERAQALGDRRRVRSGVGPAIRGVVCAVALVIVGAVVTLSPPRPPFTGGASDPLLRLDGARAVFVPADGAPPVVIGEARPLP